MANEMITHAVVDVHNTCVGVNRFLFCTNVISYFNLYYYVQ